MSPALLPGAGTPLLRLPSSSSPCLAASSWCWFSTSCMSLQEGTGHFSIFFNFYQFFPIFPIFYPLSGNCAWAPRVEGEAHREQNRTEAGCGHCHHLPAPGSPVVSHKATSQDLSAKQSLAHQPGLLPGVHHRWWCTQCGCSHTPGLSLRFFSHHTKEIRNWEHGARRGIAPEP